MADFEVKVILIDDVKPHPDADRLDIAHVGGYRCVIPKSTLKKYDKAVYIPEGSIVPDKILEEMGLTGKLAGSAKNRVKAMRLRGVLSQGLIYTPTNDIDVGTDVTQELGIKKYEPKIPTEMSGKVIPYNGKAKKLFNYDIENIKKYPDRIKDGELVSIHEKIHGTLCYIIIEGDGTLRISSKGYAKSNLVFAEEGVDNVYTKAAKFYEAALVNLRDNILNDEGFTDQVDDDFDDIIHILGEVYGRGIQDLTYGSSTPTLRIFDVYISAKNRWLEQKEIAAYLAESPLNHVPEIYTGKFSKDILEQFTSGESRVFGADHLREGVVIRTIPEREDFDGRVILKSVSDAYLTRKGGTEYN